VKLITRDTDYALRAICYIAKRQDRIVPVSELVAKLGIPRPFLRKILQALSRKRVLYSRQGKNGGFVLAVSPRKIFLMDLINIFQGRIELNECFFKKKICPDQNKCALRKIVSGIERDVFKRLKAVSIQLLLH